MTTHFGDKDQPTKLQRPLLKNTMGYGSQTGQQDKESFKHTKRWRLDYITLTYSRHVIIIYIKTFFQVTKVQIRLNDKKTKTTK